MMEKEKQPTGNIESTGTLGYEKPKDDDLSFLDDMQTSVQVVEHKATSGNPLDLPTEQFKGALERRGVNRDILMKWVRSSLVDSVDFGSIKIGGRMSRPSLWKPGAQKICGKLGVIAQFPTLSDYEQLALQDGTIKTIILRCELLNPNGDIIATGIGARTVEEDRGDLNKALKMAKKSALIDATLDMGGLSEIFTQDIEDMKYLHDDGSGFDESDVPVSQQRQQPSRETEWSMDAREQEIHFGKYKGKKWSDTEVEKSYLEWMVGSSSNPDYNMDKWIPKFAESELIHRERNAEDEINMEPEADDTEQQAPVTEPEEPVDEQEEPYLPEEVKEKIYPEDWGKADLIKLIQDKLEPKYSRLYSNAEYRNNLTAKMGTDGMVYQSRENLIKFISDMGDEIRTAEAKTTSEV